MKDSSKITRTMALLLFLHLCFVTLVNPSTKTKKQSVAKDQSAEQEARKLWEQAISAKGGRERLYSVRNVLMSSRAQYTTHLGKHNSKRREELFVLPDKTWAWDDMRPDVFGLRIEMYNYEAKISYVLTPDAPKVEIRHLTQEYTWEEFGLLNSQVVSFMETKWVKPVPMVVCQGTVNGQLVDIIQTQVFGKRFDFALDRLTRLPVLVSSYDKLITGGEGFTIFNVYLSDYVEVNGIKMPQKITPENGATYSERVQINVDYNEGIFAKPTTIEAGPEAWRSQVKR
jgi:hypothetical protein